MGYLPRKNMSKGAPRKSLREKGRRNKRSQSRIVEEDNRPVTAKKISEITLRRLHTLGSQKFGSSPFNQHFDRWCSNVEAVLTEFESHPTFGVDDEFLRECTQTLYVIKQQLEDRRHKEFTVDQEIARLSECRNHIQQINTEYIAAIKEVKAQKSLEAKRLHRDISTLKKEQERVIRMKTGFLRGISKKQRENKEAEVAQRLTDKQTELELITLNFNARQRKLREEYEEEREPVLEQIKLYRQQIRNTETDSSLEDRWFACETLIDAVNAFLQRKAAKPNDA
jgi:hypothetical protein